jgi:D-cysteine desulfhydrase
VADQLPLLQRFPALAQLPRAPFGTFPTPVHRVAFPDGRTLWIKREDLSATTIGGNKIRALEWLLGGVRANDRVLTVGPRGSTHALTTVRCARALGAHATVVRWNQAMNAAARTVSERLAAEARVFDMGVLPAAYLLAGWMRLVARPRWIPAGGTSPLGILGHVNAGLELAAQIARGDCPVPQEVVVPLGTGGTVAGIALALRIAGVRTVVRAVRVAPGFIASRGRVLALARGAASLIERHARERLPRVALADVVVDSRFYGGGYAHPIDPSPAERALDGLGIGLDDTYSRKAFAAAAAGGDTTLFWLTFDGRLLRD